MIISSEHLHDLRAGRTIELRHPFDDPSPLDFGIGERWRLTDDLWLQLRGWSADDDTEEYVYRVRKCPAPDTPRLLTPAARPAHTELGYTDRPQFAMVDAGEAVDEAAQTLITKEGWMGFNAREKQRLLDRRLLAIEERLKLAWGDGERMGIDLSDNLKAIDRIVGSMERKTGQLRDAA